ncbi:hypothetical protein K439DRAFT_1328431 [Ramaria rubella]|nr:hypothetical protein K439DRAFT_1328431 [Ramaria rubella]
MSSHQPRQQHAQQRRLSHGQYHDSHSHPDTSWAAPIQVPPPPVLQEVYILDCKSCDTFLTNRGMRAVLLLQPEVPLYSSDALPVNCSANPGPPEYAPLHETRTNYSYSAGCPSGLPTPPLRTCECLTQTLCCHGCGNAVGYMVVIPCHRCCSSVSPTNRHTNRHRFVFFNKEINASERHYIPHEPGITTNAPLLVSAVPFPGGSHPSSHDSSTTPLASHPALPPSQDRNHAIGPTPSLPTPPPDSPMSTDYASRALHTSPPEPNSHPSQFASFQFVVFNPERGKLRAGDVIYWHNLSRNGEIPAVVEDERARHAWEPSFSPSAGR